MRPRDWLLVLIGLDAEADGVALEPVRVRRRVVHARHPASAARSVFRR